MITATYIDHMGSDLSVVNAARVSFGKESEWDLLGTEIWDCTLKAKDAKLIRYLAEHKHFSPFGHAFADMAKLRCKEDTQYETRLVADQISEKMKQLFPVSWAALVGE